ncbi:putative phosphonate metabolism protein [Rhizobium sp. PP-F2F-G38]|nr:putative phosphonate metabolism protein [Rhizobium sp. PP-WC-1G-195]PYE97120.1 putative phosphonate metabolism protein [Rhizobium sp. PP-F2F-G38]TCP87711.1 putative phosphonate metabolism protein [Rhizobium sp. PP-CC-2G-626]
MRKDRKQAMIEDAMRYALYFTPPKDDALTLAAAAWLSRDAFLDGRVPTPEVPGFTTEELGTLTAEPRRYGFHATLKAPFELAPGRTETELLAALDEFSAESEPFEIPSLTLGQLGPFFALVPGAPSDALSRFAAKTVRRFEPFRAALSAEDIARRNPEMLPTAQRENLENWGYPYVFDEFRFHMTLTGAVPKVRRPAVQAALEEAFAGFLDKPLPVTALALFIEPKRGSPFTVHSLMPLGDAATEGDR